MLVLSRQVEDKIQIGSNITVTVVRIEGGKVKLGFDAPQEIHIVRDDAKQTEPVYKDRSGRVQ